MTPGGARNDSRCISKIWWRNLAVGQKENRVFGEGSYVSGEMAGKMTMRGRETQSRKNGRERFKCLERALYT